MPNKIRSSITNNLNNLNNLVNFNVTNMQKNVNSMQAPAVYNQTFSQLVLEHQPDDWSRQSILAVVSVVVCVFIVLLTLLAYVMKSRQPVAQTAYEGLPLIVIRSRRR